MSCQGFTGGATKTLSRAGHQRTASGKIEQILYMSSHSRDPGREDFEEEYQPR